MTYDDLIAHFGALSKAARALGLNRQTVHAWKTIGIPDGRQYQVEVVTGGKLRATRKQRAAAVSVAAV